MMYDCDAWSCPTLYDPMDCSLPGFSVHGTLQGGILEWVAISFSRHLPNPGIEPASLLSPALEGGFFTASTNIRKFHFFISIRPHCQIVSIWYLIFI